MGIYPSTHKSLLLKLKEGDERSWKEFYERYSPVIRQIGSRCGFPDAECEELRQDVMVKIFRNGLIFSYREEKARFRTYFNRIVRSCIADRLRKLRRREREVACELPPELPDDGPDDALFDEAWRRHRMEEALDILRQRVAPRNFLAFHLMVFQSKSAGETAEFLRMKPEQLHLAKSRCTARLRKIVAELNAADPELELHWSEK